MKQEKTGNYKWALEQIKSLYIGVEFPANIATDQELALMNAIPAVFPNAINLLCLWHINNAVFKNCKSLFTNGNEFNDFLYSWNCVCYSSSVQAFDVNWEEMQSNFGKHHSAVIYLQNTWLQHKEKFVSVWADCYLHLGSRNTSRVEGANAVLKMYLNNSSVGDLQTVHDKFTIAIRNQKNELEIQQGKERNQSLHLAKKKIFTELDGKITHFALKEIQKQLDKLLNSTVEEPLQPCQQTFSRAMGLPWAHRLHDILEADVVIPLADIDSFWYIMNDNVPPLEQPGGTRSTYFDNAIVLMQTIQESLPTVN